MSSVIVLTTDRGPSRSFCVCFSARKEVYDRKNTVYVEQQSVWRERENDITDRHLAGSVDFGVRWRWLKEINARAGGVKGA